MNSVAPAASPISKAIFAAFNAHARQLRDRPRLRDIITIGARLRRREDGMVVMVEQVHRADRLAEVKALAPRCPGDAWERARFGVPFGDLAADYDLLVRLEGLR